MKAFFDKTTIESYINKMIPRTLHQYVLRDAEYYPILAITGPRQSGKTTLVKAAFPGHDYVSLEETEPRLFARDNPREFLKRYPGPVIIDEAQRVPDLFSYLQAAEEYSTCCLSGEPNLNSRNSRSRRAPELSLSTG